MSETHEQLLNVLLAVKKSQFHWGFQ